ncbi:MAG TPA: paraquat-inducible protein A [Sulfurimonas sp.]|nr:paraquat-inducible protein A [Sulfurimonas sp.]
MKIETKLLCCRACGLMMQNNIPDFTVKCPRCLVVVSKKHHKLYYELILAIAAFLCYFPAMYLPILSFQLGSQVQEGNMLFALKYFFNGGYEILGVIVFFTTIFTPLLYIIAAIFMYGALYENRKPVLMKLYFKVLHDLREWVMLDIYVVSVLVSIIKLEEMADVIYGPGIIMLTVLAALNFLLVNAFSPKHIWDTYHNAK